MSYIGVITLTHTNTHCVLQIIKKGVVTFTFGMSVPYPSDFGPSEGPV